MRRLFRNKYFLMSLRLSAAAILLWWVMRDLKFSELSGLSRNGFLFSFGGALACVCFQIFLTSLRWRLLLAGQGISLTVFRAVSLTFQGQMFSLFMPGGAVGGDVLKAAFLTRETQNGRKLEGVTTIFLDRVIGIVPAVSDVRCVLFSTDSDFHSGNPSADFFSAGGLSGRICRGTDSAVSGCGVPDSFSGVSAAEGGWNSAWKSDPDSEFRGSLPP